MGSSRAGSNPARSDVYFVRTKEIRPIPNRLTGRNESSQNGIMFPPGLEPGTFRVLGERDNHYTTETTRSASHRSISQRSSVCFCTVLLEVRRCQREPREVELTSPSRSFSTGRLFIFEPEWTSGLMRCAQDAVSSSTPGFESRIDHLNT